MKPKPKYRSYAVMTRGETAAIAFMLLVGMPLVCAVLLAGSISGRLVELIILLVAGALALYLKLRTRIVLRATLLSVDTPFRQLRVPLDSVDADGVRLLVQDDSCTWDWEKRLYALNISAGWAWRENGRRVFVLEYKDRRAVLVPTRGAFDLVLAPLKGSEFAVLLREYARRHQDSGITATVLAISDPAQAGE